MTTSQKRIVKLDIRNGDFVDLRDGQTIRVEFIGQTGTVYGHDVDENQVTVQASQVVKNHLQ